MMVTAQQIYRLEKLVEGKCRRMYSDCIAIARASVEPIYPYGYREWIEEHLGFFISSGTLHPLLKSLVEKEYLEEVGDREEWTRKGTYIRRYSSTQLGKDFLNLRRKIDEYFWNNGDYSEYTHVTIDEMEKSVRKKYLIENLDLEVLKLAERSIHAYDIRKIFRKTFGYEISPGTLHPLLKSLAENSLLDLRLEKVNGRERKIYSTTDLGRHLLDLYRKRSEGVWKIVLMV